MKSRKRIRGIALVVCAVVVLSIVSVAFVCKSTDIPKLYFQGNIRDMHKKSDVRDITFTYDDGTTRTKGYATLKVQGTSSLSYDKKNYTINLYADEAHEEKLNIDLGWGAENKYCLKANWIDKTHARNVVTAKLVSQMQQKYDLLTQAPKNGAVDGFPVEIYSNGIFLGLYTFNIPKDGWQFGMDSDNENHIVMCCESADESGTFHAAANEESWSIEVGEDNEETWAKMNRLVDFIMNSTDEEFKENFEEYLDLDAALNYYVMMDFAYLPDNASKNMLIATYDGLKWYLSLYDLDTSWGTHYLGKEVYDYQNNPMKVDGNNLFRRMEELFSKELAQRYFELREDIFTKEHVMNEFNAFRSQIPDLTFTMEKIRWGTNPIRRPDGIPGFGYDQIEAYVDYMIPALDEKYAAMLNG